MNKYLYTVNQSLKGLNLFETLLLISILLLSVLSFIVKGEFGADNFIACLAAIIGVFCVVLGAKGSIANWIFGIVAALLSIYICISAHIYGDALQNILYCLPMQFVGWHLWSKRKLKDNSTQIQTRYMTWLVRLVYILISILLVLALGWFLKFVSPHLTGVFLQVLPNIEESYSSEMQLWLDATVTILNLVAMYVSTRAYVEQWYVWLVINILSIMLWLSSPTEFSFMIVAKYSVYLINSFYGIYMWHKLSKRTV